MPNLLLDFSKNFVSSFTPDSLSNLKSQADEIMTSVMGGAKTAQDQYRKMRSNGTFKKVTDWFFHRGDDFSMSALTEDSDDDFDAGTDFGFEPERRDNAKVLDYEGMRDLTKGQVGAMFQIGGKQVEASAMTTSEIITTVNTRSSEILSSLGNINTSLGTISSKLDQLIQLQSPPTRSRRSYGGDTGIFDSSGNITLGSAFKYVKNVGLSRTGLSELGMVLPWIQSIPSMMSMMSPAEGAGMLLGGMIDLFASDKKIFAGRTTSINDIKRDIDESVANIQNNLLTRLLSWDKFQKHFGNLMQGSGNKNYAQFIENQYTRDKAVFDGMTRKTIIDVIPSYLRKITQALTGQEYFISEHGQLTTEKANTGGFKDVFRSTIQNPFTDRQLQRMQRRAKTEMSQSDVYLAQRILLSLYVGRAMQSGDRITRSSIFDDGGYPDINAHAIELLASKSDKGMGYWSEIVNWIIGQMQIDKNARETFVRAMNKSVKSTDERFKDYARTAVNVSDVGELTQAVIDDAISSYLADTSGKDDRTYQELIDAKIIKRSDVPIGVDLNSRASDEALRNRKISQIQKDADLAGGNTSGILKSGQYDYVASIFDILNRGINVYSVKRKGPYEKMEPRIRESHPGPVATVSAAIMSGTKLLTGSSEDTGGKSDEKSESGDGIPPASVVETVQKVASKLPAPIARMVMGATGLAQSAYGAVATEFRNVQEDIGAAAGVRQLRADVANMGDSEDDKHDQSIVEAVLAAMQAATADGDTQEDLAALSSQISEIKNPDLKARVQSIVEGTLRRSGSKKPAKSKIGQILMWGWGIIKNTIVPLISKVKNFFVSMGKKFLMPLVNSLKSSGEKIITGAQSIKEGFKGSDESIGIFGRIKNLGSGIKNKFAPKKTAAETVGAMVGAGTIDGGDASNYQLYSIGDEEKQDREKEEAEKKKQEEEKKKQEEEKKAKPKRESKILKSLKETLGKSEFFQGISAAWNKKLGGNDLKPKTLADQATKGILDILKSSEGKEGGGGSIFSSLFKKLDSIRDVFSTSIERLDDKVGEEGSGGEEKKDPSSINNKSNDTLTKGNAGSMTPDESGNAMPKDGANVDNSGEGKTPGKTKGLAFDLGKIFGGFTKILGGIGQAVLTVIAGMSGFKAIMKLVQGILVKSLKPLNKAFQTMYKAMKPIVKQIQSALKDIVKYVVDIVESLIEIIQPILEAVGPIVEQLLTVLNPILEMVTDLVNILMVPLVAVMQSVVVPLLQAAANALEILLGVVQVGFGLILSAIGGLLSVVGTIAAFFSGDKSLKESGSNMVNLGTQMMKSGANSVVSGVKKSVELIGNTVKGVATQQAAKTVYEAAKETDREVDAPGGSVMEGTYGSGDAQSRYSDYLNMRNRGCGPVALADSISRRSGSNVNAKQVATIMASSGTYDPNRGTSIGSYIRASRAMGANVTPGGVTVSSLKQASPRNPITVIGSGTDFTTRSGNNHYMNVIGTSGGQAVVSNPMTGRIERKSLSSLAAHSLMGLYGSGDNDQPYKFDDDVQDSLEELKELVGQIVSMFTFESDSVEGKLAEANAQNEYQKMQLDTSSMSDEDKAKIDARARELFENDSPRYEGESDKDYEARYEQNKTKYWTQAATEIYRENVRKTAGGDDNGAVSFLKDSIGYDPETGEYLGGQLEEWYNGVKTNIDSSLASSMFNSSGTAGGSVRKGRGFYSEKGARLYTDEYTPTIYFNDASGWREGGKNYQLILGEWFEHMMDSGARMSSPYKRYGSPTDKDAVGSTGDEHGGTDFTTGGNPYIRATTGGTVEKAGEYSDGYGTHVRIRDVGGDLHIYGHMLANPGAMVKVGDVVEGGQILGKMGSTGQSTGPHLHYEIRATDSNGGVYKVNPHTFFQWHDGVDTSNDGQSRIDFSGSLASGNAWNSYANRPGVSEFMKRAFAAGLTGAQIATITSTGIWEDGGEKLWGNKSLLDVTHDSNGQAAAGIMNWVDTDTNHGSTLEEQLQWIQNTYFADGSSDYRAKVRNTGFDNADLAAYIAATGRSGWELNYGDAYGPYAETDLIEGSEHFYRGALVPKKIHEAYGVAENVGTAVGVYNWLIDQGYVTPGSSANTQWENYANTGSFTGTAAGDSEFRKSSAYTENAVDGVPYTWKQQSETGSYKVYNRKGDYLFSAVELSYFNNKPGAYQSEWIKGVKAIKIVRIKPGGEQIPMYAYDFQTTPAGQKAKSLLTTTYNGSTDIPLIISDDLSSKITGALYEGVSGTTSTPTSQSTSTSNDDGMVSFIYNPMDTVSSWDQKVSGFLWDSAKISENALENMGADIYDKLQNLKGTGSAKINKMVEFLKSPAFSGSGDMDGIDSLMDFSSESSPIILNQYRDTSTDINDHLDAILTNTYNVRSEKIEGMLSEMLKLMRERNQRRAARRKSSAASKLPADEGFPTDDIPIQVERLSVG